VNGHQIAKAMNSKDILGMGKNFSKSFESTHTPWDEKNDPELWMWKKTVLKQLGKMLPKNATINRAIAEDNKDSVISDRLEGAKEKSKELTMGNLLKNGDIKKTKEGEENQDQGGGAEGNQE
jgi:recombinational DNA repair protein RecT